MEPSANPGRSETVLSERPQCLVIDGHPIVRIGMRRILQDDFEIHEVPNRAEAVELVRDIGGYDVAVLDMRPWIGDASSSGDPGEAIKAMLRAEPSLAIVAHGERPERHLASAALQAG